ncbi:MULTISPECIES: hypothetical protein [unclassified Ensifer]|uniref:hypothetical protein n=1 Tax=unclassified Ensifer TaxID=2633371 RepID=UPI000A604421|nr:MULTISPECIES: hypothetical protein [unclassified Ensifer]
MADLQPFRIHFHDPEVAPLDIEAVDAKAARDIAIERRRVSAGDIRKVKLIREVANG